MGSTVGRASLIIKLCTGSAQLANCYFDRQATNQRVYANRKAIYEFEKWRT